MSERLTHIAPLFAAARNATLNATDTLGFEWWYRTALLAFDAQDWPTALDRLSRLADLVRSDDQSRTAVLGLALTACIQGNVPGRVETAIAQWADAPGMYFDLLRDVVRFAATQDNRAAEITLELLAKRLPSWPYIWAAKGERHDRLGNWSLSYAAWNKAQAGLGDRATLRAGVAAMHAGNLQNGRDALRKVTPDASNFAWCMTGWASSHRWFDRLRAYDALDDALTSELRAEPSHGRPTLSVIQDTLRAVLGLIPPVISDDERERLSELVTKAFLADEAAPAIQRLKSRMEAARGAPAGDEALSAEAILAQRANGTLTLTDLHTILEKPTGQWGPLHAVWLSLEGPEMAEEFEAPFAKWIDGARRPENGWLPVAEHFMSRGLFFAGKKVLRRALTEGERAPNDQFERLMEHAVAHSAEHDDKSELQWWLSQAAGR